MFKQAWDSAVTSDSIRSGFRSCGIYPVDPTAVPPIAYLPSEPYERDLPTRHESVTATTPAAATLSAPTSSGTHTPPEATSVATPVTHAGSAATLTVSNSPEATPGIPPSTYSAAPLILPTPRSALTLSVPMVYPPSDNVNMVNVPDAPFIAPLSTYSTATVALPATLDGASTFTFDLPDFSNETFDDNIVIPIISIPSPEESIPFTPSSSLSALDMAVSDISAGETTLPESITSAADWNFEVENIFKLPKVERKESKSKKAITMHRLLTSADIIKEKQELAEKKAKLEIEKENRKKQREAKNFNLQTKK